MEENSGGQGVPLFSARNVVKMFPLYEGAPVMALGGISIDIYERECLVIAGSNGSGKTLFMRIITGLLDPTSGGVFFRGKPLEKAERALRSSAGLVFQDADAQLVGETVIEDAAFGPKNLGLSKTEARAAAQKALALMGLNGKEAYPPRRLSGGEKRRLAVAGILAMGCETVIMDEPFANLDWPGVVHVLEIVRELKVSGKTVIILTHELEKILAEAERLVILHQGRIHDDGNPETVLNRLKAEYGVRDPRRDYRNIKDCTWLDPDSPS